MNRYVRILVRSVAGITAVCMALTACSDSTPKTSSTAEDSSSGTVSTRNNAIVEFSKDGGVYADAFSLEIKASEGGTIFYTTDGSDPLNSSTRQEYAAAIEITDRSGDANVISATDPGLFDAAHDKVNADQNGFTTTSVAPDDSAVDKCTVVRAVLQTDAGTYSVTQSQTYFVGDMAGHIPGIAESCAAMGTDLAVISITMDANDLFDAETGIYVKGNTYTADLLKYVQSGEYLESETSRQLDANYKQRGKEWERSANVQMFEANTDGTLSVINQDCGIRIQGNYSRSDLQKGFRLYARSDYGDNNFRYAVFGENFTNDAGETMDKFKVLTLRAGGNCAFTTKYSDTYWQSLIGKLDCETQQSRPAVVYLNGEYWGVYILQEDYTDDYFEDTHGVNKDDVVVYKGDAETYDIGYKLDEGTIPEGESEDYYYQDLLKFFNTHTSLESDESYAEFAELVDVQSAMDYFAVEIWINNKWDWPGKNWSMWRTINVDESNEYADGKWRFCFYDVEFGGVSGSQDAYTNTIKEDNYKPGGLLDKSTNNPAVLCFAYLMTNEGFRAEFSERILSLSDTVFERESATAALDTMNNSYVPLLEQFFARYPGSGSVAESVSGGYASYQCIKDFLARRAENIQTMLDWAEDYYK